MKKLIFHPQLDAYLKAHLFGDIFARDTLDWRTREIVTIAALAARPETEPQMKAHIALEVPGTEQSNEWCESVDDTAYTEATMRNQP